MYSDHGFNNRCCWYHKGTNFQANHNTTFTFSTLLFVVADTTKVRIFKQITTDVCENGLINRCCWYHKGTNFQANHNQNGYIFCRRQVVADTTKVRIFKQITTKYKYKRNILSCCWYHKGTNFQANHNVHLRNRLYFRLLLIPQRYEFSSKSQRRADFSALQSVVADTTKVRIFKQITTQISYAGCRTMLLLIPQRYEFSSKSQQLSLIKINWYGCCWYHKGTNFQANHNSLTNVKIFSTLLLIPQRYEFSSKSQLAFDSRTGYRGCCWYHKGTNFQANHNATKWWQRTIGVVADTTKVRIFKQITTRDIQLFYTCCCCWYHKGTNFQANHNKNRYDVSLC